MTRYKMIIIFLLLIFTLTCCDSQEQTIYNSELDFLKTASTGTTVVFHFPDFPHRADYVPVFEEISARAKRALGINLEFKRPEGILNYVVDHSDSMDPFYTKKFDAAVLYVDFAELVEDNKIMDITELFPENAPELYRKFTTDYAERSHFQMGDECTRNTKGNL